MITVYATSNHGEGYVMEIAKYDNEEEFFDQFEMPMNMFASDVVITLRRDG